MSKLVLKGDVIRTIILRARDDAVMRG